MNLFLQEDVLGFARALVQRSPAHETEVSVAGVQDSFVRFGAQGPSQNADRERAEVSIRVRLKEGEGYREARATCGSLADADADAALGRALALARVSEPNAELPPLGGAVNVPETAAQRPTMDHSFREKAKAVGRALEACRAQDLLPAGLFQTTALSRGLVNSAGREVFGARSRASFALTASSGAPDGSGLSGEGSGFAESISDNVERVDTQGVVERAVAKAVSSRAPRALAAGEYTVVLEPAAVSSLLLFAAYHGFGAQEVSERSSLLCGRIGETLFPEELTLVDDAANPVYSGFSFDGEGAPRQRAVLLSGGRLGQPVTDARWSKKLGVANTGHGKQQPTTDGPSPENLILAPGAASRENLIAGVERGLLVTQFHYTNMIEPLDLVLTGMTRNGTYWIEGGEVQHPVRNLRFTQSLVGALQAVTGIGREQEVAGALFDGELVAPAVRIDGFRFTSSTDF